MKVAVTGASGFLGRAVVQRLLDAGHSVVALGRNPGAMAKSVPKGVAARRFDAGQPVPADVFEGCEAIVNLAGELIGQRWNAKVKERIRQSRVDGTRALVKAACEAKTVRTLISASAVGYYGARGNEPLTEISAPGSDFLAEVCRDWEQAAVGARGCGIRVALLRIGLVLHPEGAAFQQMLPLFKLGLGGRIGTGEQVMSWVHRDDVVALIEHVLTRPELDGAINATAPNPVTNAEFTRALGKALGRPTFLPVPTFALKAAFGEMSFAVLTGQRVLPDRATASGFAFRYPTLDDAMRSFFAER